MDLRRMVWTALAALVVMGGAGALALAPAGAGPAWPASVITWQPVVYLGSANGNLAPAVHPTDPLRALLGGPLPLRYTTDGGITWLNASVPAGLGPGVPIWLPGGSGQGAIQVSLTPGPSSGAPQLSRSSDSGAHWAAPTTLTLTNTTATLPYLWADANPASPYYGRLYLTLTLLDPAQTGSFDTVGLLTSTDQGATWSTPVGLVDPTEYSQGTNYNAFAAAAVQPNGGVVVAWHRGQHDTTLTTVPNKVMWARSTDGGVTFPVSGTIAAVPVNQSLPYGSTSPGGFRWTPAPNIAADPVDGTLYAAWIAYRQAGMPFSAATYLARSTDNGASWSAPVIVDDTQPMRYQYVPWVQVSRDHVVHVTYGAATTTVAVIAHFYAQSTDRGVTWSAPFSLNIQGHINGAVQGDFQATSLGGDTGAQGTILTAWEEENGTGVRVGTFPLGGGGTPSPTPPPATLTPTASSTPTHTPSTTATATILTPTPASPTPTACPVQFSDVDAGNPFYTYIRCLACRGIVAGYTTSPPCATAPCFLPGNNVTRGQTAKFVSNAANYQDPIPSTQQTFTDVPPSSPFWLYIERAVAHGVISGYSSSPPCTTGVPCFLPGNPVTRGQTAKFVANAANYGDPIPSSQQIFTDVPPSSPFWLYVERVYLHGVISGYSSSPPCTTGVPCFLAGNNVTRGQTSKFIANAFFPNCQTPRR